MRFFLARTAWSQGKIQILAKNCADFVHEHSRKPHPNLLRDLCRCTPAQISHNLTTFWDAPAHLLHIFPGLVRRAARTSFAQFSRAHGLFSNSASVKAVGVSSVGLRANVSFQGSKLFGAISLSLCRRAALARGKTFDRPEGWTH